MEKYVFIAVNYNNSGFTIEYVKSITNFAEVEDSSIIIVDNYSDKEDYINLQRELLNIKNLILIRSPSNIGYFQGLNLGISSINNIKEKMVIISNNDIRFAENFIFNLKNIKYDNSVLVLAPNIITKDGVHQNPHRINRLSKKQKLLIRIFYSNYNIAKAMKIISSLLKKAKMYRNNTVYDKEMFIYQGVGACYILTENFFRYYSILDGSVFLWGEEALLANQVYLVGGKTLYNPNIILYHDESASINKIPSRKVYEISKYSYGIYSKDL